MERVRAHGCRTKTGSANSDLATQFNGVNDGNKATKYSNPLGG
jgi:hypothetical protein